MSRIALITGITGQDGSFLAEELISKDYAVIGLKRRTSTDNTENIKVLRHPNFQLIEGDLTDAWSINQIISAYKPDEVYNLAAQSHVGTSFKQPEYTFQVNAIGVLNLLEAIRNNCPQCRFLQASTSEMFGSNYDISEIGIKYQDESTPFKPRSPYAVSKVAAHHLVANYREAHSIFAVASICFNHESERRGELFVSRKITKWVANFKKWVDTLSSSSTVSLVFRNNSVYVPKIGNVANSPSFPKLRLGNLDAQRDWGYARDYVRAMFLMMQNESPKDYVISTGRARSIRNFLDVAFKYIGIKDWSNYVVIDPEFYRPSDVEYLNGYSTKIREDLNWEPTVSFNEMVNIMIEEDL